MENELLKTIERLPAAKKFAVGNDLVFVPDFEKSLNSLFQKKVYTANEIAYCEQFTKPKIRYASAWAAKEAIYKAIKQIDNSSLGWKKIEIIHDTPGGRPQVIVHDHPADLHISLTISHDGDYVWAVAFIQFNG